MKKLIGLKETEQQNIRINKNLISKINTFRSQLENKKITKAEAINIVLERGLEVLYKADKTFDFEFDIRVVIDKIYHQDDLTRKEIMGLLKWLYNLKYRTFPISKNFSLLIKDIIYSDWFEPMDYNPDHIAKRYNQNKSAIDIIEARMDAGDIWLTSDSFLDRLNIMECMECSNPVAINNFIRANSDVFYKNIQFYNFLNNKNATPNNYQNVDSQVTQWKNEDSSFFYSVDDGEVNLCCQIKLNKEEDIVIHLDSYIEIRLSELSLTSKYGWKFDSPFHKYANLGLGGCFGYKKLVFKASNGEEYSRQVIKSIRDYKVDNEVKWMYLADIYGDIV